MGAGILDTLANFSPTRFAAQNQVAELQPQAVQANIAQTQQQTAGLALQQKLQQQQLQDAQVIRQAYTNTSGNPDDVRNYLLKNGISGTGFMGWQQHAYDLQTKAAQLKKDELANEVAAHEQVGNILQGIRNAPPEQRASAIAEGLPTIQRLEPNGPWQTWAQQPPTDQELDYQLGAHGFAGKILEQAAKKADIAKSQQETVTSAAAAANSQAQLPKIQAEAKIAQAKADRWAQLQQNPASLDAQIDGEIDPKQYPVENARAKLAAHAATDYDEAQKAIKDSSDRIGRLEASVAQAKATQPIKIETAVATQNAAANAAAQGGGLDLMAQQALNGTFSSRNPILMAKVYGRAAEMAKEMGLNSQQVIMEQNAAKANKTAFDSVTKQYETLKPFAEMAEKNADILEQKSKEVSSLGGSFFNTPVRELEGKFGSAKVAAYKAALLPVQADFARILNSPTASRELSDSARHEMQGAIGPGATPQQIKAALDVFRTDAKNRKASYEAALSDLKGKTVVGGSSNSSNAGNAGAGLPKGNGQAIDKATAQKFYEAAGKDPAKARKLAAENGWKVQ